jgi:AraC-like DNA-binding protein
MDRPPLFLRETHEIGKRTREFLIHPEHCSLLQRHRIILAGISLAAPGFRFVRLAPSLGQILVCFRGEGRVWVDGAWKKCDAGRAYLSPPGKVHAYEAGRRWDVGWICHEPGAAFGASENPRLVETDPRPFEHILSGLHHEISTDREAPVLEYWGLLLYRHACRIAAPDHSSRLWRLWRTVQADLAAEWDLAKMARLASLGPEHLRRVCLRETERSPMQHLAHLRMQYAASLLTTGRKIQEVAEMAGYTNAFAFSTAFKRIMKQPPSRFRL